MPSLIEEDPEYPKKVAEYCAKHGLKELPWGFIVAHGHMVATTSVAQRREHAAHEASLSPESKRMLEEGLRSALAGELVVPKLDEPDPAKRVESVTGEQVSNGAAAVGVQAANAGAVVPAIVKAG